MAVEAMRAMLRELMPDQDDRPKRNLEDPEVCKDYCLGFCLGQEFERTKHEQPPCTLVHDDDCKAQWEALDDRKKERLGYERNLKRKLDRMMEELAVKVKKNEERLAAIDNPPLAPEDQAKIDAMNARIAELVALSEAAGEAGDVDAAQAAAADVEALKAQKVALERDALSRGLGGRPDQRLQQEVCQLSGVITNKEESRQRDHKAGRNYLAWVKAHEKYRELKETTKRRDDERRKEAPLATASRERERDRSRDHDRSRDRDRDRERERDGRRDRDRDRDRERHSRDHDRGRHGDRRERRRSRSRSRDRDGKRRHRERSPDLARENGSQR